MANLRQYSEPARVAGDIVTRTIPCRDEAGRTKFVEAQCVVLDQKVLPGGVRVTRYKVVSPGG